MREPPRPGNMSMHTGLLGEGVALGTRSEASPQTRSHHLDQSIAPQSIWVTTFFKNQRNDYSLAQISSAEKAVRHLHEGLGGSGALCCHSRLSF